MVDTWIETSKYEEIKKLMPISCVDLLIIHEGKLLLMLRNNEPGKDLWFTPGGRILKGESLEQAVNRVLEKETGLESIQIKQVATMCHYWPTTQTVTTYYTIEVDTDKLTMNNEHRDHKWINKPTPDLHPYLTEMITNSKIFTK